MLNGGIYMRMYLIKRESVLLSVILLISAVFIFPPDAYSAGTIKLNKNAVLNITQADSESKGGGPFLRPQGFVLQAPNVAYVNKSENTLKAASTVAIGKIKYWAKLNTQFTVARGDSNQISGKARVTVYGGHYKGEVKACGLAGANVLLHMNVADQQKDTDEGANILLDGVNNLGAKKFDKDFEKSIELTVIAGRTYNVDVELDTEVGGVDISGMVISDFYSERYQTDAGWVTANYGVKYQGIKVTILESFSGTFGPGRYR